MKRAAAVIPLVSLALLAGCAIAQVFPAVRGAPVALATHQGNTITLTDGPCALMKRVANLPYRATWRDAAGKSFEGCYDIRHGPLVVMYFEDRTVVTAPFSLFVPPAGA